ncbi:hypothetical protein [Nocardioides sp. W7]|uniref:hypothetical protein n=1 Tax=Nocardioides sp. W7 TaxID=2931390 RepID=UPI001FD4C90B|nr:hypothetical protein [Nocardioides sp. W7]
MRRIGTWAAAIVLGAGVLAGCGGDDSSDGGSDNADGDSGSSYCDELGEFRDTLQGSDEASSFEKFRDAAEDLAEDSPDEVSGEWKKIEEALGQLESELEKAGISLDDLNDPSALQSADPEAMAKVQESLSTIGEDVEGAADKISEHAKSECDIDLNGESPSPSPSS